MAEPYISFYLKANCIHVYTRTLREIGSPKRICIMLGEYGKSLLVAPYENRDFKSHRVPSLVYSGDDTMRICSVRLCNLIIASHGWNSSCSYRVPGKYISEHNVIIFCLADAEIIGRGKNKGC